MRIGFIHYDFVDVELLLILVGLIARHLEALGERVEECEVWHLLVEAAMLNIRVTFRDLLLVVGKLVLVPSLLGHLRISGGARAVWPKSNSQYMCVYMYL